MNAPVWGKSGGWRRLMIWKNCFAIFTCFLWGVTGVSPVEGGSGSPEGWSVGEGFPPLILEIMHKRTDRLCLVIQQGFGGWRTTRLFHFYSSLLYTYSGGGFLLYEYSVCYLSGASSCHVMQKVCFCKTILTSYEREYTIL
jgi:hypothetical protein